MIRSAETSPVECNGSKASETRLRLQSQEEALERLREDLASQKVRRRRACKALWSPHSTPAHGRRA